MLYRLEISPLPHCRDARGEAVGRQFGQWLNCRPPAVRTRDVYTIQAALTRDEAERLVRDLAHPVIQRGVVGETPEAGWDWLVTVGFLPGVTDNVARTLAMAMRDALGRPLAAGEQTFSSTEYLLSAPGLTREQVQRAAVELLANPLIQSVRVLARADWEQGGCPPHCPVVTGGGDPRVETLDLNVADGALVRLSDERTLALTLAELHAIKAYFAAHGRDPARAALGLGPNPTDCELESLAQTWSEHCKHKIFAADIEYTDEAGRRQEIRGLFNSFIRRGTEDLRAACPWLLSVFKDNAGVIAFNDRYDLVYKVETHNSPSALDPYGGAMTGIVGVNRDPLGTGIGADLLLNVWGYCLASPFTPPGEVPEGLLHPRRIRNGVHRGVIEGGNQSGIPYGLGWEYFDQRYLGKPLVFCGTVGLLPRTVAGRPGYEKDIRPGDHIVMAGGRIGKDGIHGATFSSEELHGGSPVQAVQIGDPITQKRLSDFQKEARDRGLYRFVTDNGAGGLSCSFGEMARECGGCRFDLARAPLKYAGLQPWEILLSEAQERMSYAVPPEHLAAFLDLAARREVEATVLGEFTNNGKFHVTYGERTVAFLDLDFLHDGGPRLKLHATWAPPSYPEPQLPADPDLGDLLTRLLGRLNLCSNEVMGRQYDHEVKGLSVVKPFVGVATDVASDGAVFLAEPCGRDGIVLTSAVLPRYADLDCYHMTAATIDLAVRRAVGLGARLGEIAGLDNFCWPDPVESPKTPDGRHKLAQLVRANQALYDYCLAFRVPCISGKDSMKNDSTKGGRKISIPPTLLFSTIARVADVSKAMNLAAKRQGDLVYVLGTTRRELGGSEFYALLGAIGNRVPQVDAAASVRLCDALSAALEVDLCRSVHAPGLGGLGAGFARVALGSKLGMDVDLAKVPAAEAMSSAELLFSESCSRFIVTVPKSAAARFEALFAGQPCACVGQVKYEPVVTFFQGAALEAEVPLAELRDAYQQTLADA